MHTCLWTLQQVLYAERKIYKYAYYMPVMNMVHAWEYLYHARYTHAYTTHGICLYHVWNMPVPCMEYACTMHGIRLYHAWNTSVSSMEYASTTHGIWLETCMDYEAVVHACNMHGTYL